MNNNNDNEIKLIIEDIFFHIDEIFQFLKSLKIGKHDTYIEDLIDYTLCTFEDINTLKVYIQELEIIIYQLKHSEDIYE